MTHTAPKLSDLIGSRICHDLISPLGAISNGLELLEMSGLARTTPEVQMIADSIENANARVKFFRVAYGAANPDQRISEREVTEILADISRGGRCGLAWEISGDAPRLMVKLAFLLIQCLETAMPRGGDIVVASEGPTWVVRGQSERIDLDEALWARLSADRADDLGDTIPAQVQFSLAPLTAKDFNRSLAVSVSEDVVEVRF